jgi:hypothetical protein
MPNFRRGAAEIEKSTQRTGGTFSPFAPSIYWKAGEEKYLLILTPIDDVPRLEMINFIPVKNKDGERVRFDSVIARSDACFEEDALKVDPLVKEWDAPLKDSNLLVAVELEPELQEKRGRLKPVGFSVKLTEFERRIRDEEGEVTEDTETVTAPAYGFIQESAKNFGSVLSSHDASEFPIEAWPVKISRIGGDENTKYTITGYEEMEVDLTPFVENLDGISYLGEQLDEVKSAVEDTDPKDAALAVASVLLEARLNELADQERYDRLYAGVDTSMAYKKGGKGQRNGGEKAEKPSQRAKSSNGGEKAEKAEKPKQPKQRSSESMAALEKLKASAASRK